jgi:hypothetical protein
LLSRLFELPGRRLAYAAVLRAWEVGDAGEANWVRADPASVVADAAAARLMGVGLGLTRPEADSLLHAVRSLFGDAGWELSAPHPERWYLKLPPGSPLPEFSSPWHALGDDLRPHLPQGADAPRWRRLMNEAQMLLHDHPMHAARSQVGLAPANSLWFWGAGRLPTALRARIDALASEDPLLCAMARAAQIPCAATLPTDGAALGAIDLRAGRDLELLDRQWIEPAERALKRGSVPALEIVFADGESLTCSRASAFAFWRRDGGLT